MTNDCSPNKDGSYVIQEQGDLGLGTTKIDPKYTDKNGNIQTPEFGFNNTKPNEE